MNDGISVKINKVVVLRRRNATDLIYLTIDAPTPFPNMKYEAKFSGEAQHGYGVEWVKSTLGVDPEIIDC